MFNKIYFKNVFIILIILGLFLNISAITADDSFDYTNDEDVDIVQIYGEKVIYKGTDEMDVPNTNELNPENFTNEMFEKEVYVYDDTPLDLNRSVNSNSNFKIVFNSQKIHQSSKLTVHLETLNNNSLIQLPSNTPFYFLINGVGYTRYTDSYGLCSININLQASSTEYPVQVTFSGNSQYSAKSITKNITVYQKNVVLTPITYYVQQHTPFCIKLTDDTGVPIANKDVTFNIHGVQYNRTTNSTGVAQLNINLNPYTYQITYEFITQNGYLSLTQKSLNLVVNTDVINTNTKLNSLSTFVQRNNYYYVKLTTAAGTVLSNQQVKISINGVDYDKTTDSNGIASLRITLSKGTYSIVVNYAGTSSYHCSSLYHLIHTSNSTLNDVNTESDLTIYRIDNNSQCDYSQSYIQTLSSAITSSCTGDLEKAIAIYNYVYNFRKDKGYVNARYGDLKAILVNDGDCVNHTHAFVSLARASGLAVQYVHGINNPNYINHLWARVCIDNEWIVADATNTKLFGNYNSITYPTMNSYSIIFINWYD